MFEGEEESGSEQPRRVADGQPGAPRRRRRGHQRHGLLRGQPAGDHDRPARPHVRPDRRVGTPIDLHSGSYGGAVENPANALARSSPRSRAPTAGSGSRASTTTSSPLTDADRAAFAALPFDEEAFRASSACPRWSASPASRTLERRGARPTLDVNGIWGGFQGEGSKTIIPAHAHAKVTCRLVPDQDPERIFERCRDYVAEIAPPGVPTDVQVLGGGLPSLTPIGPSGDPGGRPRDRGDVRAGAGLHPRGRLDPGLRAVRARSWACRSCCSGSRQPDDHAHAPNEWMVLDNYETGSGPFARLWDELAARAASGREPR